MPDSQQIDRVFSALANPARREILALLAERGQRPVQELAEHFDMARPSVSEHLKVLRDAGLVSEERSGRNRLYSMQIVPLQQLRLWIDGHERFWNERMAAFRAVLDEGDQ
ncbi:MAG TPA: metalloregulator ArsR/SmtB family transcription factor [Devosiaceae bacterium]|jgi:DNA-binding transcriptional ArsR family regulator|nr:metalloregulator ArsR/SmtB family transcription factor [Devosiaceae bacterium]